MESLRPIKAARWEAEAWAILGPRAPICRLARAGPVTIFQGPIVSTSKPTRSVHYDLQRKVGGNSDLFKARAVLQLFAVFQLERWSRLPSPYSGHLQQCGFSLQDDAGEALGFSSFQANPSNGVSPPRAYVNGDVRHLILWSHGSLHFVSGTPRTKRPTKAIKEILEQDGNWLPQLCLLSADASSKHTKKLMINQGLWRKTGLLEDEDVPNDLALARLTDLLQRYLIDLTRDIKTVLVMVSNAHKEFENAVITLTNSKLPKGEPSHKTPFVALLKSPNTSWRKTSTLDKGGWNLANVHMMNEYFGARKE